MELIEITEVNDALAQMVAQFRVELRTYKGIVSKPNKVNHFCAYHQKSIILF